ncbi:type II toxin-antitoxin system VapC family toxin [Spirosoma panaciterrae]|uniref:type II toxin-antitoxin system VapC family toxin n=1 Tax=Spirosoma panaciterrae TaxID=496058 RepID=UPI00037D534A|nr:type II toxin-antitoxin system VapC family toxin [Spirosoma panaciterrae]
MNLLIDTHALIWFLNGNETELSLKARQLIANPTTVSFVSIASLWEMAIKIRLGSLSFEPGYDNLLNLLAQNGFEILPITFQHTRQLLTLPMHHLHHRDPFDRVLIAQSVVENLLLVTADSNIYQYEVDWIW